MRFPTTAMQISIERAASAPATAQAAAVGRKYLLESVGPLAVIQIYADGFDQLSSNQRLLAYYLAQAGQVVDARVRYTLDFPEVMLTYSRQSLGYLPAK
jgi:hypothetical protein